RLVGDAPPADQPRLEPEALRQRGRLRPAAVPDDHALALGAQPLEIARQRRERARRHHLAAELDDDHGQAPGSSSVSRSSRPSIRFMLWIAWPAPPLIKLSATEKQVTVRRPSASGVSASANPTSTKFDPDTAATSGSRFWGTRTKGSPANDSA